MEKTQAGRRWVKNVNVQKPRLLQKCDGKSGILMQSYAVKLRELAKIEGICENCSWNEMKKKKKAIPPNPCSHHGVPKGTMVGGGRVAALV